MKKHILHIRKQSRIELPKESLWFFSEDSIVNQSPVTKRKTARNDHLSIYQDDYNRYSLENSGRNKKEKDCTFVVDWQM
jgi:hypothetical protein